MNNAKETTVVFTIPPLACVGLQEAAAKERKLRVKVSVDHSAFIYLMGLDGNFLEVFRFGISPEKMAEKITEEVKKQRG